MQRKTLPNSSACCRPDEVNSPPHLQISSNEASFFSSADSSELEFQIDFSFSVVKMKVVNRKYVIENM